MHNTFRSNALKLVATTAIVFSSSWALASDQEEMKQKLLACAGCHEQQDNEQRNYAPSIAGKPVEYLYQQLLNYREGRRVNNTMQMMLASLNTDYLHEIASYYASLPAKAPRGEHSTTELTATQIAMGKALAQKGSAGPACIACHGNDLKGDGVAIPGLRGLSAFYIAAQLGAWQANTRQARAPDCMKEVASQLTGEEISAVALWIENSFEEASTPQPLDAEPPLPCGALSGSLK